MKSNLVLTALSIACFTIASCSGEKEDNASKQETSTEKKTVETEASGELFTLGEAAHIAIGTENAEESAAFYEKLGFKTIEKDVTPYPWIRMTDGCVIININQDSMEYMGMTYFTADGEEKFKMLDSIGCNYFAKIPGEDGNLKQVICTSPDSVLGFSVIAHDPTTMNWPTTLNMSAMMADEEVTLADSPNALCGMFGEFSAPVEDLQASIDYWSQLGFDVVGKYDQPYPFAILSDGLTIFGLHQTPMESWTYPALTYFRGNTENFLDQLIESGISEDNIEELEDQPNNYVLTSPEGQHIFLFKM